MNHLNTIVYSAIIIVSTACSSTATTQVIGSAGSAGMDVGSPVGGMTQTATTSTVSSGSSTGSTIGGSSGVSVGGSSSVSTGTNVGGSAGSSSSTSIGGNSAVLDSPVMVQMPSGYWIDTTEVTRGQYDAWTATNPVPNQPAECNWNTDLIPRCYVTDEDPRRPVGCVDWCDAYAFCAAAGKRLCGALDGGPSAMANINTTNDEWFDACSSGGINTAANGNMSAGEGCTAAGTSSQAKYVLESKTCTSKIAGYTGVYDLTGNVEEWTNSCNGTDGATDTCLYRGGSYGSSTTNCATTAYTTRSSRYGSVGFRCCKDLS